MKVTARFFAVYREKLGCNSQQLELDDGATAGDLLEQLSRRHGVLFAGKEAVAVAVNGEYVPKDHVLKEGDEVALIPPVSGG